MDPRRPSRHGCATVTLSASAPGSTATATTAPRGKLVAKGYAIVGEFSSAGHNTSGFLRLFGGLNRGRPEADDLARARQFARSLQGRL
jgi:hypothetical protein